MKTWWAAYGAALLAIGAFDALWLGWLATDFYTRELAGLAAPQVRVLPAAIFYFAYPAGLVTLALWPRPDRLWAALWRSALVGLVGYGTYDLTNMATLRQWSLTLALVDTGWGTFISACAGALAWRAMRAVSRQG